MLSRFFLYIKSIYIIYLSIMRHKDAKWFLKAIQLYIRVALSVKQVLVTLDNYTTKLKIKS